MNSVQRSERYCDLFYCNKIDKEFHFRNFRNALHYLRSQFLPRDYRSSVHHLENFARLIQILIKIVCSPGSIFLFNLYNGIVHNYVQYVSFVHVPNACTILWF